VETALFIAKGCPCMGVDANNPGSNLLMCLCLCVKNVWSAMMVNLPQLESAPGMTIGLNRKA
jgi:hypothetical protein